MSDQRPQSPPDYSSDIHLLSGKGSAHKPKTVISFRIFRKIYHQNLSYSKKAFISVDFDMIQSGNLLTEAISKQQISLFSLSI